MFKGKLLFAAALITTVLQFSCGTQTQEDPLEDMVLTVSYYDGNDPVTLTGASATVKSDRSIDFAFSNYTSEVSGIDLVRVVNGVTSTCDIVDLNEDVRFSFSDWPASTTEYSVVVYAGSDSRTFGPYTFTVEASGELIWGSVSMGDQSNDISGFGPFFHSRNVGWGSTPVYANWTSQQAAYNPRLLDFAILTDSLELKVLSPDDVHTIFTFNRMVYDCGFTTTTFSPYTGTIDPELAEPTLAEIVALPDPPAAGRALALSANLRFVYQTAEGKKGLVKIKTITNSQGGKRVTLFYACQQ